LLETLEDITTTMQSERIGMNVIKSNIIRQSAAKILSYNVNCNKDKVQRLFRNEVDYFISYLIIETARFVFITNMSNNTNKI